MLIIKNMTNNTMYIVQELHTFSESFNGIIESINILLHSSTNLLTTFFYTYNFHNQSILLHNMIHHIHNHNY